MDYGGVGVSVDYGGAGVSVDYGGAGPLPVNIWERAK